MRITARHDGAGTGVQTGQLALEVQKPELVTIETTYAKLEVPGTQGDDGDVENAAGLNGSGSASAPATASIEVKKLLKVLTGLIASDVKIQNAIICVAPSASLVLKVYLHDSSGQSFIIYYLPVMLEPAG